MANTNTSQKGYVKQVTGENLDSWGAFLNTNWDAVDDNLGGVAAISLSNTDYTLNTTTEAPKLILNLTGTLTANINVIVPQKSGMYIVRRATTGAFTVTVKTTAVSTTTVALPTAGISLLVVDTTFNVRLAAIPAVGGVSWSASGWATHVQLTQGQGIHWQKGAYTEGWFAGVSGDGFYVMSGPTLADGTGLATSRFLVTSSGASVNSLPVITTSNFTTYYSMRRTDYGASGLGAAGTWTWGGSGELSPDGTFATDVVTYADGTRYVYYHYLQWKWNGTWFNLIS